MKPIYKLIRGNILKDGHVMFKEDIVKDLNYYSSKALDTVVQQPLSSSTDATPKPLSAASHSGERCVK